MVTTPASMQASAGAVWGSGALASTSRQDRLKLCGDGGGEDLERVRAKFPTGALAILVTTPDWGRLAPGCARLAELWTPR